ncbi:MULTISPECIES: AAA family ATPase [unclassified Fusibacter]|uniref:AAA family ATPase n=1 Tax=unclassified Fusibacter TaxID=2624464 RepID=UPI0010121AE2|nr:MULTISPECIES: AAA family ATPase [unclassified Fusibacter]MCK8061702.1 AAA family ATPase [Fusibacter sp. A2]NPE23871.1 AAA family ATPase [Fusibacter sp. A1]RXV58546.1 hypothetical protein DWB64_18970 [Fusibacter sp. A1]
MSTKNEFHKWVNQLESKDLSDIDCKLINILTDNFDIIEPLSTAGGSRAKKLVDLITSNHETASPELNLTKSEEAEAKGDNLKIDSLNIGPFRGFVSEEKFTFDKKYTFIYGPNGSGKSSFCEGLELALFGDVEEARGKRIKLADYIENADVKKSEVPKAFGKNEDKELIQIIPNSQLYRFSFFEKNRIDSFARITAETASAQKDRIATLFGLDSFNKFVDGFTENFDKYLSTNNVKEKKFSEVSVKYEQDKVNLQNLKRDLEKCNKDIKDLISEINREDVITKADIELFLKGDENKQGYLNELQKLNVEQIPENQDVKIFDEFFLFPDRVNKHIECYKKSQEALTKEASKVDYKDLYSSIISLRQHQEGQMTKCPACKTPLDKVVVNPYENASLELENFKNIIAIQSEFKSSGENIIKLFSDFKRFITTVNKDTKVNVDLGIYTNKSELNIDDLYDSVILNQLLFSDENRQLFSDQLKAIMQHIENDNKVKSEKRASKIKIEDDLKKYQNYYDKLIGINSKEEDYCEKIGEVEKRIFDFENENEKNLKEIEKEKEIISTRKKYLDSYAKLLDNLKSYRLNLPKDLAYGLADKVKEYYNIINSHDPEFELIEELILPIKSGDIIGVKFQGEEVIHDALYILSEGHIKVLGLAILLSKAVKENLGFLVYDDIVNAIDDDHRSGIAELLMGHSDFINRQHILTCHGEQFINKLEHKLGASLASKEVKRYRFVPLDMQTQRGIKISIGDPKHYLLQAKQAIEIDSRKKAASSCRQAVESIAEKLWKKISKEKNVSLSVKLRGPGGKPDLASLIDSLKKELGAIDKSTEIYLSLKELKEKYNWALLNKGTHEEDALPEFDRKDILSLYKLVTKIEGEVIKIKFTTEVVKE